MYMFSTNFMFQETEDIFLSQALNHISSYPLLLLSDPLHNFLGVLVPVYKLSTWSELGTSSQPINLKKKKVYPLGQKILYISAVSGNPTMLNG